ncbi:MAG: tRNA (adenosine(37)-N6)-threonylcarbamoyltransferase complex transferase subunit TsaD, partial [Candidatus Dadabacteria bacterium]|nr:tRNA (adenosine(37)-N6)-threonylcarbamoyltransferase complex transferase subunit TsaD [Candidatus Dadabacteria bacterium]
MTSLILAIESSCDETSASVIKNGTDILSNIVSSQADIHKKYGGVVPEIASRKHVETIIPIINESIEEAGIRLDELGAIAVTNGPGLIGSLMVGLSTAKSIAFSLDIPLIAVDHIEAHAYSVNLENKITLPYIALVVSGGHTSLYRVNAYNSFELIGNTRDDAAGEAFDKGAKLLGLEYPGGIQIDKLSKNGNQNKYDFPRPFLKSDSFDFSFSGLKTSLVHFLKKNEISSEQMLSDVCASYQEAIAETLIEKTLRASDEFNISEVALAGGVAANSRIRELAQRRFSENNINLYIPHIRYCT